MSVLEPGQPRRASSSTNLARVLAALLGAIILVAPIVVLGVPAKSKPKTKPPAHAKARKPSLPIVPVDSVFRVNDAPISPDAKIFLVAGSSLTASFPWEVVEQRRLWLAAGFHESEIACYYIVPLQEDLNDDQKEFLAAAPELQKCYPMSMKLLRSHLETVAAAGKTPYLYLYVTSHGDKPVKKTLKEAKPADDDYWSLRRDAKRPEFDQYHILIEGLTDGTATSTEVLGALRAGVPPEQLYFTPGYLSRELAKLFPDTPKFIVLQGCFSGGFIEDPDPARHSDLLSMLKNVTVIAAARHDRSSFGCDPGGHLTFFGEAFEGVLAKRIADPRGIAWMELYDDLTRRVTELERREKMSPPSLPQFFSNYEAPR